MCSIITFNIDTQLLGIDMTYVEKIMHLSKISSIPNSVGFLEGVIDFQNTLIPLINLKKKLHCKNEDVAPDSSIIIISNATDKLGVLVDYVNDIVTVEKNAISKHLGNALVSGVVKVDQDIVSLINPDSLSLNL